MRFLPVVLLLVACGQKSTPAPAAAAVEPSPEVAPAPEPEAPAEPTGLIPVSVLADLSGADGKRVAVQGTVTRATVPGTEVQGTVLTLSDDGQIWVSFGEPPHGWDWLLDSEVRVEGTLLEKDPVHGVPTLEDPDAPMPGQVAPSLDMPSASDLLK